VRRDVRAGGRPAPSTLPTEQTNISIPQNPAANSVQYEEQIMREGPSVETVSMQHDDCQRRDSGVGGWIVLLAVLGSAGVPDAAHAQWGFGRGGMGGYASTAAQAADYGMAQVVRAAGYAHQQNSQAANNWEDAKTKEIDNREKWTNTYFDMRKTNREARAEERGPAITQEQAIRLANTRAPSRLTSLELDPVTGHITYPLVLTDSVFDPYRQNVDRLFAERATSGGSVSYDQFQEIQQAVNDFAEALKQRVDKYAAGDYGSARTFLTSLAHEARFPGS
jgi:hypothetical protein